MAASYRLRNMVHTVVLLGGMALLVAALGWLFAGPVGIAWAVGLGAILLFAGARVSGALLMRLYRARPIPRAELPGLYAIVDELAGRAGLARVPHLLYVPSPAVQAFTVDLREGPAVAVTDGLLRAMEPRQLAAVLAHEIAHVRRGDVRLMTIADVVTRVARTFAVTGMLLLAVNLPVYLLGGEPVPWLPALALVAAPTLGVLLQLALSRTREYDADHTAAVLTGDPQALAAALARLERYHGRMWEQMVMPGYRLPEPSLLRTHPATADRLARLADIPPGRPLASLAAFRPRAPDAAPVRPPRWRPFGFWS